MVVRLFTHAPMKSIQLFRAVHAVNTRYSCYAVCNVNSYMLVCNNVDLSHHFSRRYKSLDSDYGKFSNPGKIESFYEWATETSWIQSVEKCLIIIHDATGLPWWASIIISTFMLRAVITTPLYVIQMKNNAKYAMFLPSFMQLYKKLAEEVNESATIKKWDEKTARRIFLANLSRHRKNLYKEHKVPGLAKRYLLPWVQIPLWISVSISLRHFTGFLPINVLPSSTLENVAMQMSQEGGLWLLNLCQADPYFILPVLFGIVNLGIIEIYRGDGKSKPTGMEKFMVYFSRTISIVLIPIACQMPAAVVLYWFSSSLYGAFQALLFRSYRVKDFFRIPYPVNESHTPYRDLLDRFSLKNRLK